MEFVFKIASRASIITQSTDFVIFFQNLSGSFGATFGSRQQRQYANIMTFCFDVSGPQN